jgi:hypothetical protein
MIDAYLIQVDLRKVGGRQIDLARRNGEVLADVVLVVHCKFYFLPAAGLAHDHLAHSERRRQWDSDHRHPARAVLNDQRAVPVGIDIGHRGAHGIEAKDLDAAGHRILLRQIRTCGGCRSRTAQR